MAELGSIAELRQLIFSYSEKLDLLVCARVCSTWTEDAIEIAGVWKKLPSPLPLLRLADEGSLCPTMTWTRGQEYATISKPVSWTRFRRYAARVRKISFTNSSSSKQILEKLALIKALSPDPSLLPNLETVVVFPSSQIIYVPVVAMFLHNGVRRLKIYPPEGDGPTFFTYPDFFREVLERSPFLESLHIGESNLLTRTRDWRREDAGILAGYASQFPRLIRLAAPAVVLAELKNISTIFPNLRALIETSALSRKVLADHAWQWSIRPGPLIEHLAFSLPFSGATQMLNTNPLSHLRILYLEAHIYPQEPSMTAFFRCLPTRCPALEELTIRWVGVMRGLAAGPVRSRELDVSEFDSLADCVRLSILDISAVCTLTFNEAGAIRFPAVLPPRLRICRLIFILLSGPVGERHTFPSLASLASFAAHCRYLQELSIVLDPKVPDDTDTIPVIPFGPAFRKLSIGHYVEAEGWDPSTAARYLAKLVTQDCSLGVPPRPYSTGRWKDQDEEVTAGESRLKEAFELVPTFM
ncbi:hypothetical protein DFH06DRAFT_1465859 [Mycena polygramma]|nr:hypothetical protein DFH06DRAFT_1465859 [Mycena polygramma]